MREEVIQSCDKMDFRHNRLTVNKVAIGYQ